MNNPPLTSVLAITLAAILMTACTSMNNDTESMDTAATESRNTSSTQSRPDPSGDDPYLWLEGVEDEKALAWVEENNAESLGYLQNLDTYQPLYERNLAIYNSDDRIAYPSQRGDYVFNFWRDEDNKKGLWRRASLESYLSGEPDWQVMIDVDQLAEQEDENWVWKGASCLRPDYTRCLVNLSRGGADATVVREFDITEGGFVEDGFYLPEAKSSLFWIDEDTVFVGTDFGEGSLTDSGYARIAKIWNRGEPLSEARTVFEGEKSDVFAGAFRTWDGDTGYNVLTRAPSFFTSRYWLLKDDGEQVRIDIPEDADLEGVVQNQLLVELKSAWDVGGQTYPQGALLSIGLDDFLAGERDFQVLVTPTDTSAIDGVTSTRDYLIVNHLDNVTNTLERFRLEDGQWIGEKLKADDLGSISVVSSADTSNDFFYTYEGFLQPDTLVFARDGGMETRTVSSLPAFFDSEGMQVDQHFATSRDGTRVPYFVVTPPGFEADGENPTLLYGYGGFEVSLKPGYNATTGSSWLQKGGVYAVANIRGGGEFGPDWHQAALKENRQRAYDDFIAVAEDLIERGVTSPDHLGIRGGSNGGLLMGVMLTQRPDLFDAIVVQVPLLDMKRYNKLLAGASWMGEYGDPDTDDWQFIQEYSPYQNLDADADYPKAFFTTSTRDDRVHPGHARKMVAKMRAQDHDLLYYENTEGGHAGASDNEQQAKVQALVYSYLWDQLADDTRQ